MVTVVSLLSDVCAQTGDMDQVEINHLRPRGETKHSLLCDSTSNYTVPVKVCRFIVVDISTFSFSLNIYFLNLKFKFHSPFFQMAATSTAIIPGVSYSIINCNRPAGGSEPTLRLHLPTFETRI